MTPNNSRRMSCAVALLTLAAAAEAHTGHGTHSLAQGLLHPLGLDHLLVMLAVGLWSLRGLGAQRAWQGPAVFLLSLVLGAALGLQGLMLPQLEALLALTVLMLGAMLMQPDRALPPALGLGLVASAALLHGMAHGAEAPATAWGAYALGFVCSTAVLHLGGLGLGLVLQRGFAAHSRSVLRVLGAAMGAAGLYLVGQLAA
ncbi:HupE/UreJ family protein [Roseateles sp. BYS180W]|uniref:HupE/UreJ family protein n=1 Tax=Roseateles rivi TaxID=3299028 RepID=A0ABW7FW65_9BURK